MMRRPREKEISGCAVAGIMSQAGWKFDGSVIIKAMSAMRERSNGLGAGFAAYGIYPQHPDCYAFHLIFENEQARKQTEEYLQKNCTIEKGEPIPTRYSEQIKYPPGLWRYFLEIRDEELKESSGINEEDLIVKTVMYINTSIADAFVCSSGKNMGVFKGVGFPEEIGAFYRLEEYEGYIWIAHGRFPTNSVGWWGGAHPFGLLDWAVVHNGEISSYGINKRYLLNFGYNCSLFTDTEAITYLLDLLVRKHRLSFQMVARILAAPFWDEIERMSNSSRQIAEALRVTYGSALLNGPFSIIAGHSEGMLGLNDRIKLRPLVAGRKGDFLYLSSEESGIREVCPHPDEVWSPKAGEPVIGKLNMGESEKKNRRPQKTYVPQVMSSSLPNEEL